MRELKFRAWVNDHWVDWIPTCKTLGAYNASIIDTDGYTFEEDNPVIVEQYTGFKDKNGKEIYEGDILGGIFEGCYIGWCDITKSFELFNCYERYCMACDGDILWCELSDSDIDLEVIGNIHENPELLRGEE